MLDGTVDEYMAQQFAGRLPPIRPWGSLETLDGDEGSDSDDDSDNADGPMPGPQAETMTLLASMSCKFQNGVKDTS